MFEVIGVMLVVACIVGVGAMSYAAYAIFAGLSDSTALGVIAAAIPVVVSAITWIGGCV